MPWSRTCLWGIIFCCADASFCSDSFGPASVMHVTPASGVCLVAALQVDTILRNASAMWYQMRCQIQYVCSKTPELPFGKITWNLKFVNFYRNSRPTGATKFNVIVLARFRMIRFWLLFNPFTVSPSLSQWAPIELAKKRKFLSCLRAWSMVVFWCISDDWSCTLVLL